MVTLTSLDIARGDAVFPPAVHQGFPSPIEGVSPNAWAMFVDALQTQAIDHVTPSGNLGHFELRPRRLEDIGWMENVRSERDASGHRAWVGDFVPPVTKEIFLSNYLAQYNALVHSVTDHLITVESAIDWPEDMSLSGRLAILHRTGPGGLRSWLKKNLRFDGTAHLYDRANEIF